MASPKLSSGYTPSASSTSFAPTSGRAHARPKLDRQDTERLLSYYESPLADGEPYLGPLSPDSTDDSHVRPPFRRQSSAGSTSSSDYSSESAASQFTGKRTRKEAQTTRQRPIISTEGGTDRRRMAVVQVEHRPALTKISSGSVLETLHSSSDNLRSRRGIEGRMGDIALVAPPDADAKSYTYITPPSTAPIVTDKSRRPLIDDASNGHQRSASEAGGKKAGNTLQHKSSRDVGIVGAGTSRSSMNVRSQFSSDALHPPIFQTPHSRAPSPGVAGADSASSHHSLAVSNTSLILTPDIGQEKDIHDRVAAPVMVDLSGSGYPFHTMPTNQAIVPPIVFQPTSSPMPSPPFSPVDNSAYLHYQPGIHATAGPLPPPPRTAFDAEGHSPPPPRPPRLHSPPPTKRRGDMDAVRQALQLPPFVAAALASRSSSGNLSKLKDRTSSRNSSWVDLGSASQNTSETEEQTADSTSGSQHHASKSVHVREGAFPPSVLLSPGMTFNSEANSRRRLSPSSLDKSMEDLMSDVGDAIAADKLDQVVSSQVDILVPSPPTVVVEPLRPQRPAFESLRDDSFMSPELPRGVSPTPADHTRRVSWEALPRTSLTRSSTRSGSDHGHTGNTPSPPPKSVRHSLTNNLKRFSALPRTPSRRSATSVDHSHFSPSPSPPPSSMSTPRPQPRRHRIKDKSPSAMYFSDVLTHKSALERCAGYARKINELYNYDCGLADWMVEVRSGGNAQSPKKRSSLMPTTNITPQRRHTSRSSMMSEVTFPRRADATVATDLTFRALADATPLPTGPPPLPYPSLLPNARSGAFSPSSMRHLAPVSVVKSGGFFASLGRKASLNKKSGPSSPTSSSRVLTKNPPTHPRTVNIPANVSPSVPGGPRAPPNHRLLRSQTIMISPPFASEDVVTRRPSLFALSSTDAVPVLDIHADPEFVRQVDKLADLLPQADRDVLAGYLRRAGQDILAIGQYLEDEKNGTIRSY